MFKIFKVFRVLPIILAFSLALFLPLLFSISSSANSSMAVSRGDTLPPLAPEGGPNFHPLAASFKTVSQFSAVSGETITFAIKLINTGPESATVDVTDPLSEKIEYITDSANEGGAYNENTRTLAWQGIEVPPNSWVSLTFQTLIVINPTMPEPIVNIATISLPDHDFNRATALMVLPASGVPGPNLDASYKRASRHLVCDQAAFQYTIHLHNTGNEVALATVTDEIPAELEYVPGSANYNASYDEATRTLTWQDIDVASMASIHLSFQAKPRQGIIRPNIVVNTARISYNGTNIYRQAWVMLHSQAPSASANLLGSHKTASSRVVSPGETLTYTVVVHNSGRQPAIADVKDPVPLQFAVDETSVTAEGIFNPSTHTVSWTGVEVPPGASLPLSFSVAPAVTVTVPELITNTAVISYNGTTINRYHAVTLAPESPGEDVEPPQVHSLTIEDRDVLTDPQTTLHISANDNVDLAWMFIKEWSLDTSGERPHWKKVQNSGWVPFQADYPWKLNEASGVHYVAVWVADSALNISFMSHNAIDFASLLLPETTLDRFQMVPYLVYYDEGVEVSATATPISGDVDLFAWFPNNSFIPDQKSAVSGSAPETITFTTPQAGVYLFIILAAEPTTFTMDIAPDGGPRSPLMLNPGKIHSPTNPVQEYLMEEDGLTFEPLLSESGLDPLADPLAEAETPSRPYLLYLPGVVR